MPEDKDYLVWVESTEYNKIHLGHPKKHKWVKYKGGRCQRCEYDTCVQSLTFHHINPLNKKFSFGRFSKIELPARKNQTTVGKSTEQIYSELDKCVLLCHNCHYELHAGLWLIQEIISSPKLKQTELKI